MPFTPIITLIGLETFWPFFRIDEESLGGLRRRGVAGMSGKRDEQGGKQQQERECAHDWKLPLVIVGDVADATRQAARVSDRATPRQCRTGKEIGSGDYPSG